MHCALVSQASSCNRCKMGSSIREIAAKARVSTATVSRALRDSPLVRPELRKRVEETAKSLGYSYAPLVGSVLSIVRRGTQQSFLGTLAMVQIASTSDAKLLPFQEAIVRGARARAKSLGFS